LEHTSTLRGAVRVDRGRLEVPVTPRLSRYPFFSSFFRGDSTPSGYHVSPGSPGPVPLGCPFRTETALELAQIERVVWNPNWIDLEVER
jgi:hypothetical protein